MSDWWKMGRYDTAPKRLEVERETKVYLWLANGRRVSKRDYHETREAAIRSGMVEVESAIESAEKHRERLAGRRARLTMLLDNLPTEPQHEGTD